MAHKGIPTLCIPHQSAGVIEAPDRDVKVGAPATFVALNGDPCPCAVGGPDLIMAGMTDIVVGDVPVAGWMHHTSHNASTPFAPNAMVERGDTWILMGGGTTVGNVQASLAACRCLQAGRANKSPNQSGQNCGVESMRQIINAKRRREGKAELSEDELLNDTLTHGDSYVTPDKNAQWDATLIGKDNAVKKARARLDAAEKSYQDSVSVWNANKGDAAKAAAASDFKDQDRYWAGGTLPEQQRKVLDRHGIPTTEVSQDPSEPQNMKDIEDAVGRGKGVVVGMKAGPLWGTNAGGDHAILVTGVSYDESGQVVGYITNDTAMGCGRRVPKDQFRGALRPELKATVTRDPVW